MVYFDERPKERVEDLYDRERELGLLIESIRGGKPLVLLLGLRRTGKTSLLKVALNVLGVPSIVIDCRVFEDRPAVGSYEFIKVLESEVQRVVRRFRGLLEFLRGVEGVSVAGVQVRFRWGREGRVSLSEVLRVLNEWGESRGLNVVVALDEAQELMKLRGINILSVIAHTYDYLRRVTFILTGSKIGLLYRFLRVDDPKSPLYGRAWVEVLLRNLSRDEALDFLIKGFEQVGITPKQEVLEYAVSKLNGVIGWLTYFGSLSLRYGLSMETVELTLERASKLALSELMNFLKLREVARQRYINILYITSLTPTTWSEIKRFIELKEGREVSPSNITLLIKNLIDAGFLIKKKGKYYIPDPILAHAIRKNYHKLIR